MTTDQTIPNVSESDFLAGSLRLFRRSLTLPRPMARVIIHHGYGEHSERYIEFMRHLASHGIESHTYDARGHGRSQGRRGFIRHWDEYLDDLRVFAATIPTDAPRFLLGHSHGGLVAVTAMQRATVVVDGYVLSSPFLDTSLPIPRHKVMLSKIANIFVPWMRFGSGLNGQMMTHDEKLIEESSKDPYLLRTATPRWFHGALHAQKLARANAVNCRSPMLLVIGTDDVIANPIANREFFAHASSTDKTLKEYQGLRHELLREVERQQVFEEISSWIETRASKATR